MLAAVIAPRHPSATGSIIATGAPTGAGAATPAASPVLASNGVGMAGPATPGASPVIPPYMQPVLSLPSQEAVKANSAKVQAAAQALYDAAAASFSGKKAAA